MTNKETALLHADILAAHLKTQLPHRRLDAFQRLAEFLRALLQADSTLHQKIAFHLPRDAKLESKIRIIARALHGA